MTKQTVVFREVTRDDVERIREWLKDDEVSESWFGRYSYGDPAHLGYHPTEMASASEDEWNRVFADPAHRILSVYTPEGEHIGETHVAIEETLGDGQVSVLIGRRDLWHRGYGTAAMAGLVDKSFNELELYRVWVDVPEYNEAARAMCEHLGFVHEGTLRKSRPHEGSRFDSVVMGMLATEYAARLEQPSAEVHTV